MQRTRECGEGSRAGREGRLRGCYFHGFFAWRLYPTGVYYSRFERDMERSGQRRRNQRQGRHFGMDVCTPFTWDGQNGRWMASSLSRHKLLAAVGLLVLAMFLAVGNTGEAVAQSAGPMAGAMIDAAAAERPE